MTPSRTPPAHHTKTVISPAASDNNRYLQLRFALLAGLALVGLVFGLWLTTTYNGKPDPANRFNVFYVLFARQEPAGLALVLIFATAGLFWARRGFPAIRWQPRINLKIAVPLLAFAVFALTSFGTSAVFQQYALTADENMADFQARIFLNGRISQPVTEFWQPMIRLLTPIHAIYNSETHSWMSRYLPVYAALRALFMSVGLEWLTNPVLAALSVLAIAAVAAKIWPNESWKPFLATLLLAATPQFLVTSMTSYAMPAHLALNLFWLWLYCEPAKRRFWLAPFVGIAALGLHQPFFHALFVTPFLFRLVLERRWKAVFWFGGTYLLGIASWYAWWLHFVPANASGAGAAFALHPRTLLVGGMYLALLLGWTALPIPLLALLGLGQSRKASSLLRDIAASCVLTFSFYVFVRLDQGHGWGDRYFYGVLGCLVLLAVSGWDTLCARLGLQRAATFVGVGLVATALIQAPLRCQQAERFTRPFAAAAALFQNANADLLAYEPRMAWYSADLRRNDPALRDRPTIVSFFGMKEEEAHLLQKTFPRSRLISEEELTNLGLETKQISN